MKDDGEIYHWRRSESWEIVLWCMSSLFFWFRERLKDSDRIQVLCEIFMPDDGPFFAFIFDLGNSIFSI